MYSPLYLTAHGGVERKYKYILQIIQKSPLICIADKKHVNNRNMEIDFKSCANERKVAETRKKDMILEQLKAEINLFYDKIAKSLRRENAVLKAEIKRLEKENAMLKAENEAFNNIALQNSVSGQNHA